MSVVDTEFLSKSRIEFEQALGNFLRAFENTPDDRLNWSPSATARTPIHLAAHIGLTIESMLGNARGDTFAVPTPAEAEAYFREFEQPFQSRQEVLDLIEKSRTNYLNWLASVNEDDLDTLVGLPFGFPNVPRSVAINFMPQHVAWHTAQLHYIQTIYGDQDWHL